MPHSPDALGALERDLRAIVGARLQSLVRYSAGVARPGVHTLAIVDRLSRDDLRAIADKVAAWHDAHLATPLLLPAHEFEAALDAFPLEFGAILSNYSVVAGSDPFAGLSVAPADLRRACEMQARSHLLHLRQGFLETRGRPDAVAALIVRSAAPFAALLKTIERLEGARPHIGDGIAADVVKLSEVTEISSDEAQRIFPPYLDAVERLVEYVDRWE
jgi:hypothetical protein